MRRVPLAVLLLALSWPLAAGCAGNARPDAGDDAAAGAAPDSLAGEVRRVGSTPFVRTIVEGDSAAVTVAGPLETELARLAGARVRVFGARVEGEGPGTALEVERYEVLAVDGERPRVGRLGYETGIGYRLIPEAGQAIPLASVPTGLGTEVGAKVWVVLNDAGGVVRYGVLREP